MYNEKWTIKNLFFSISNIIIARIKYIFILYFYFIYSQYLFFIVLFYNFVVLYCIIYISFFAAQLVFDIFRN